MKTAVIAFVAAIALLGVVSARVVEEPKYHPLGPFYHENKCSYYTDQYDHVKISDYENKKCFALLVGGKWAKVGFVCTTIIDYDGKKCIKFFFQAADDYKFLVVKAGADASCAYKDIKHPFQAKAYGHYKKHVNYVCLDEFYAYPGEDHEGCCNTNICIFIKVIAKKRYCGKGGKCYWSAEKLYAFPPSGQFGCYRNEYDYFSRCSVPLICKDHKKLPVPEVPIDEEPAVEKSAVEERR